MLAGIIDAYIAEKRDKEERGNDKFRVSSAGMCRLARYWKRQGKAETDPPDVRTLRVFEVGKIHHEWVQGILREKGLLIACEETLEDKDRRGHLDAIVKAEKPILYDLKSCHSGKFSYLEKGEVDAHRAHQIVTYALMWNEAHPDQQVNDCRLVYISKDDLRIAERPVWIAEWEAKVEEDWSLLERAWIDQCEPKPNGEPWMCRYCEYRTACEVRMDRR